MLSAKFSFSSTPYHNHAIKVNGKKGGAARKTEIGSKIKTPTKRRGFVLSGKNKLLSIQAPVKKKWVELFLFNTTRTFSLLKLLFR